MRASGPPPTLQDFEDNFDFLGPVMGVGQDFSETYMEERLIGIDYNRENWGIHESTKQKESENVERMKSTESIVITVFVSVAREFKVD